MLYVAAGALVAQFGYLLLWTATVVELIDGPSSFTGVVLLLLMFLNLYWTSQARYASRSAPQAAPSDRTAPGRSTREAPERHALASHLRAGIAARRDGVRRRQCRACVPRDDRRELDGRAGRWQQ